MNIKAEIKVVLMEDGNLAVTAPLDTILSLGMLEAAKVVVMKKGQPDIVIPKSGVKLVG